MKTLLLWFAVGLLTVANAATNLLTNGDFENGLLAPWTGTGVSVVPFGLGKDCLITSSSSSVEQTFTTAAGKQYYLGADLAPNGGVGSIGIITLQPAAGGANLATRAISVPQRFGLVFTATSESSKVIFTVTANPLPSIGSMRLDNLVIYEIPASSLAGRYSGTATTTVNLTFPGAASLKTTTKLAARVTPEGLIVLVTGTLVQGLILPDGTMEFPTLATPVRGTAKIKGRRLTFTLPGSVLMSSGLTGGDPANTGFQLLLGDSSTTYVLTRVGL